MQEEVWSSSIWFFGYSFAHFISVCDGLSPPRVSLQIHKPQQTIYHIKEQK
jgi:hypothetical protein